MWTFQSKDVAIITGDFLGVSNASTKAATYLVWNRQDAYSNSGMKFDYLHMEPRLLHISISPYDLEIAFGKTRSDAGEAPLASTTIQRPGQYGY